MAGNAPVVAQGANGDEKLYVEFGYFPVLNEIKTAEAGRPIYEDVEFIKIIVPGDKDNIVHRPFWNDETNINSDICRFRTKYMEWKARGTQPEEAGTKLSLWPGITSALVKELEFYKVTTVEQLATLNDVHAQKFPGIQQLKRRAQDFIEAARGNAPMEKMRSELEARDAQIRVLQDAVEKMQRASESEEKIDGRTKAGRAAKAAAQAQE